MTDAAVDRDRRRALRDFCFDAVNWLPELDFGDAADFVAWFVDTVIAQLRDDPSVPHRTTSQWELFFADLTRDAESDLTELVEGRADRYDFGDAVADALLEDEEDDEQAEASQS